GQFDAGEMLNSGALTFGGWSTSGSEGATCLIDLAAIKRYTPGDMRDGYSDEEHRKEIDMINLWNSIAPGYVSFSSPNNDVYMNSRWSTIQSVQRVQAWDLSERNKTEFIHYHNASEAEIQAVMNLTTRDQLIAAYEQSVIDLPSRS